MAFSVPLINVNTGAFFSISANKSTASHAWLWALLPLLLAAALAIPLLGVDAFNGDEPASLLAAGIEHSGPLSLEATWSFITNSDPHQAYGWPLLLAIWGRLVGWSEVAVRALPLFAGCLTLAWVYRTGRDLLAPQAGLFATLLLSASAFFLAYQVHARVFTLIALCTTLCIWSYWRIVIHPRPTGLGAPTGLLLGSVGLLYSNYFCALFLLALGLFHLLFAPKNRRWLRPVLLIAVAALLAMPQLPGFLQGLDKTAGNEGLHSRALAATAVVSHFVRFLTNGLIDPSTPISELLLLTLPLVLALVTLLRLRNVVRISPLWLLAFTALSGLAVMIVTNEFIQVIVANRIRYLMPLWPLTALLVGAGLWRLVNRRRILATGIVALWLIYVAWLTLATDFRYELGYFFRTDIRQPFPVVRQLFPVVRQLVPASDLLIIDYTPVLVQPGWFYDRKESQRNVYRYKADPYETVRQNHADYPYLWLLYLSKDRVGFADLPHELGRVFCERALDEWGITLERYALHSVENCPDRPVRLVFDSGIRLTALEITVQDDLLRLDAHFRSEDDSLLSDYSLAVHIIDSRTGQRVAQGDTGVGPGAIVPFRSEIDVRALPPGDYELRVALYDWQTGGRLSARDPETDAESDMHTLHRFHLG